jgi:type II secretory pathway pseudopilin PulG
MQKNRKNKGFSLVELSVILLIISTAMVSYLTWMNQSKQNNAFKAITTREKISVINKAIQNFVLIHGRLPCPAKPSLNLGSFYTVGATTIAYDNERIDFASGLVCDYHAGSVPTRSIGISPDYMLDGWNMRFNYIASPDLCGITGCSPNTYNTNSGELVVKDQDNNLLTDKAAYVLFSVGSARRGGYVRDGNRMPLSSNIDELENTDFSDSMNPANLFYKQQPLTNDFTHILSYKTKEQLKSSQAGNNQTLVSLIDCNNNDHLLRLITRNISTHPTNGIRAQIPYFIDNQIAYFDIVVLDLLWSLQEACFHIYPASQLNTIFSPQNTKWCPGGASGGGIFNPIDNSCLCPNGTWNGDC